MKTFTTISFILLAFVNVQGTIRTVPSQFSSIQLALNASAVNDTVLVDPGTYYENIQWPSIVSVKLFSTGGANATIINGGAAGRVIEINGTGNVSGLVIDGFTIMNGLCVGSNAFNGAGIFVSDVNPVFKNLIVTQNRIGSSDWSYGAGIHASGSNVTLIDSKIISNVIDSGSWSFGAGIYVEDGSIQISGCEISENEAISTSWCYGGGIYITTATFTIDQTKIQRNILKDGAIWYYGAGFYAEESSGDITNVLVSDNVTSSTGNFHAGGGVDVESYSTAFTVTVSNSTIANNLSGSTSNNSVLNDGDSLFINNSIIWSSLAGTELSGTAGMTFARYSDVKGGFAGNGNLNIPPAFTALNDYHLQLQSPCVNSADASTAALVDLENNQRPLPAGSNSDMGCYEIDEAASQIQEAGEVTGISVSPNPSSQQISIRANCSVQKIEIYNPSGQQEFSSDIKDFNGAYTVHVSSFTPGIYFLLAKSSEKNFVEKLIIEH